MEDFVKLRHLGILVHRRRAIGRRPFSEVFVEHANRAKRLP